MKLLPFSICHGFVFCCETLYDCLYNLVSGPSHGIVTQTAHKTQLTLVSTSRYMTSFDRPSCQETLAASLVSGMGPR